MRILLRLFFPWLEKFKKLGLTKHWWHRLATVCFFVALFLVCLISSVFIFSSFDPTHTTMPDIQCWSVDTDGNPQELVLGPPVTQSQYDELARQHKGDAHFSPVPVGVRLLSAPSGVSIDWNAPLVTKVDMPDGTTADFTNKSDTEIRGTWNRALQAYRRKAWLMSAGLTLAAVLLFNYLTQFIYGAVLYVIYGTNKEANSHP